MTQFAGIDIGQEHTYSCILDTSSRTFHYADDRMGLQETIAWLRQFNRLSGGCVDGPPNPNTGRLAQRLPIGTKHNVNRRLTEFQLGIDGCYSTRGVRPQPGDSNFWMQSAFELFQLLATEFGWSINKGNSNGQLIETHPTYAFKALLGDKRNTIDGIERIRLDPQSVLRKKKSREGHQQRIELLTALCGEIGVEVNDNLSQKWNSRIDWVDAAICSFMSYWQQSGHSELESPGDALEGAIYLRIPSMPLTVTAHDFPIRNTVRRSGSPAPPRHSLGGASTPANAIIMRLGDTSELSQLDTIDTILSSDDLGSFWFPCGSNAMPQLCENLTSVGGRLFLSWGPRLHIDLRVSTCCQNDVPLAYPAGDDNPWPLSECQRWLQISECAEINTDQFYTNQHGEWTQGFGTGQTALLWAVVPEGEGHT